METRFVMIYHKLIVFQQYCFQSLLQCCHLNKLVVVNELIEEFPAFEGITADIPPHPYVRGHQNINLLYRALEKIQDHEAIFLLFVVLLILETLVEGLN